MSLLSAAEQAQLQADFVAAACDLPCDIYHKTTTSGSSGEPLANYGNAPAISTMAGMTQPSGTLLQNYASLIGSLKTWHIKLPPNTDARHQDHFVIKGKTLEVNVLLDPQSYPVFTNCLASEVE